MSEENVEWHEEEWAHKFRDAADPFLGREDLEAAGVFQRPDSFIPFDNPFWLIGSLIPSLFRRVGGLAKGRVGYLPRSFVLALTREKVHAFTYEGWTGTVIREEIAVFDRDEIRLRSIAGNGPYGEKRLFLDAIENGRTHTIKLDAKVVDQYPGAAGVVDALEAAGLSE